MFQASQAHHHEVWIVHAAYGTLPLCRCLCREAIQKRPHDKDICRGGEYHRLHVQFRPPDDGPVRPETCRGKRIADIICRRKRIVYRFGNKREKKKKLYWEARSIKYQSYLKSCHTDTIKPCFKTKFYVTELFFIITDRYFPSERHKPWGEKRLGQSP